MAVASRGQASAPKTPSRGLDGRASAEARRKAGQTRKPAADDLATQQFLKDLLCSKDVDGDENGGEAASALAAEANLKLGDAAVAKEALAMAAPPPVQKSPLEIEEEKRQFIAKASGPRTRPEVQEWLGKVFLMDQTAQAAADAKERSRRRRLRSSSAASDSGHSGQTGYTGVTGTTATALQTAGGNIAGGARSVESGESLVVHPNLKEEPLNMKERIQAFLENRVPELQEHIEAHVAKRTEDLRKEVDGGVAEHFLRTAQNRKVFDGRANYLRWQNARHQALQQRLDARLPNWILEAIDAWEAQPPESKQKEVNETDLIFEYLTKRAAHIDTGKLPSQIPVLKKLKYSYSLPRMWKDKFINQ